MTKTTMIWQTLSMIIAGIITRQELPETKELFEQQVLDAAKSILDFPEDEIKDVLHTVDCTQFGIIMAKIHTVV